MNLTENKEIILPYEKVEEHYIEDLGKLPKKPFYSFVKRSFDLIVSLLGILIFLIPMLIVAITIKLTSEGPVFFRQERLGKNGEKFNVIKFRTMVADAEKNGAQWCSGNDDERITKTGKLLRKYHIDEIPQLWCIFTGHMSFVGPRPEVAHFVEFYTEDWLATLLIKPGITCESSIYFADEAEVLDQSDNAEACYINTILPKKCELNIDYIKNISILNDIKIMLKTVKRVLS